MARRHQPRHHLLEQSGRGESGLFDSFEGRAFEGIADPRQRHQPADFRQSDAHHHERNPLFQGGVHGILGNNLIYDPGPRAIHYNRAPEEWGTVPFEVGKMTVVGNVLRAGPSTPTDRLAFMMIGGAGDVEYYGRDNIAVDQVGEPLRMFGRYTTAP